MRFMFFESEIKSEKTVETVEPPRCRRLSSLKRGVNENGAEQYHGANTKTGTLTSGFLSVNLSVGGLNL
jgi:hypothetical protein